MSKRYLKFELLVVLRNKKNQLFFLLFLSLGIMYMLLFVPSSEETIQSNKVEMGHYLDSQEEYHKGLIKNKNLTPAMSYAIKSYENHNTSYEHLLGGNHYLYTVTSAKQLEIFIEGLRAGYFSPGDEFSDNYENPLAYSIHLYTFEKLTAEALIKQGKTELPYVYSLTTLQQLKDGIIKGLPFLLFVIIIFYGHDMMVLSYKNPSIVRSIPLSMTKQLLLKSVVLVVISLLTFTAVIFFPFVKSVVTNGIGSLSLPVTIYAGEYKTINLGEFYIFSIIMLTLMVWGLTRLSILLGFMIRNQYLILIILISFILMGEILEQISFFPRNYLMYIPSVFLDIGKVIVGEEAFLLHDSLTTRIGIFVWLTFIVILEVFIFLIRKSKMQRGKG